jgi:hypothetical protein
MVVCYRFSPMSLATVQRPPARFDASVVIGATPAPFPGFVEPCHPTLREEAPAGAGWVADASERILYAEHPEGDGLEFQEGAGAMGVIVETPASPPNR